LSDEKDNQIRYPKPKHLQIRNEKNERARFPKSCPCATFLTFIQELGIIKYSMMVEHGSEVQYNVATHLYAFGKTAPLHGKGEGAQEGDREKSGSHTMAEI
jgi:hypothetical protein